MTFKITEATQRGSFAFVRVEGIIEADGASLLVPLLALTLINEVEVGEGNIIIDLSKADVGDANAILTLISVKHRVISAGGFFYLVMPELESNLEQKIKNAGLKGFFQIFQTADDAFDAMNEALDAKSSKAGFV